MSQFSRRIFTILGLTIACVIKVMGQSEADITNLIADTKTFAFDDKQTTVKGYIYEQLESETSCCGSDRIYLEVRIHPSGYVIDAKTLTGKNECFKSSAIDIVKNIKWDAEEFKGTKPVYFEIRPDINCEASKTNEYTQVAIINNELLDEEGNPKDPEAGKTIYLGDTGSEEEPESTTTTAESNSVEESTAETNPDEEVEESEDMPQEEESTETLASTTDVEDAGSETVEEGEQEQADQIEIAASEAKEPQISNTQPSSEDVDKVSDSQAITPQVNTPSTSEEETESSTKSNSQPILIAANESNDGPSRDVAEETQAIGEREGVTVVDTPPVTAQREETEEEKARKDAEIEQLQTQLEELRAKEEALQDREQQRQEYQRRRREALEERRRQMQQQEGQNQDDPFASGGEGDPFEGDEAEENAGVASRDDQDRDQEDIDRLSQELSDIESRKRELQESRRRDAEEIREYIQDRLRVEEEIRRKQEEITRRREQQELDRMVEDMRQLEDDKRELESEMQRLMDEIQRLQDEMNKKVAELERQEMEIQRLNTNLAQRENEVNRQRILREQQLEQELALKEQQAELEMMGLSGATVPSRTTPTPSITIDPQLLQRADTSESARAMVNQIMQLQEQIQYYQNQLQSMQGQPTAPGQQAYTQGGVSGTTGIPDDVNRADQDQSWQNIDYNAPGGQNRPTQGNVGVRQPTGQAGTGYDPTYGYSPDSSHASTYKNVAGPRFRNIQYGTGSDAMNRFIVDQLRNNGICGPVTAFAELTVNGQGQVTNVRPIKANTTQVLINLPVALNGLTFLPTYSEIPQYLNIEFRTTIRCGGTTPGTGAQFNPAMSNPASNR